MQPDPGFAVCSRAGIHGFKKLFEPLDFITCSFLIAKPRGVALGIG
jgi:hypothetical protein